MGDSEPFPPCLDGLGAAWRRFVLAAGCHDLHPRVTGVAAPLTGFERATAAGHYTQPMRAANGTIGQEISLLPRVIAAVARRLPLLGQHRQPVPVLGLINLAASVALR
jgi:hypothetical protein